MKRFQNLLVVVQPGFEPLLARWAGEIARNAESRELCFLHFEDQPDPLLTKALGEPERRERDAAGAAALDAMNGAEGLKVRHLTLPLSNPRSLLEELVHGGYDLVIAPTGDPGTRTRALFLCRKAPCPVLLLPEGASDRIRKILVAVDFSQFSQDAIDIAAGFARTCQLDELDLIHSWHQPVGYGWKIDDDLMREQIEETAREQMAELAAGHDHPKLPWKIHVRQSVEPYYAILDASRELHVDLTVISSRGKNALSEALLGSSATEVVNYIGNACLVVKRKGAGTGLLRELLGLARVGESA
jgi:nucleotide-binding universal stress UspA family protein